MMTIRVLGSGLIPRGLGLAPRMAPTPASLTLIQTIMATKGLTVEFCKPDGTWIKLTRENLTGMWAAYGANNATVKPTQTSTANGSKPVTPEPKFATAATAPAATNVVNEKTEAPAVKADDKVAEKKDEPTSAESKDEKTDEKKNNNLKVVNNPNDKKHN